MFTYLTDIKTPEEKQEGDIFKRSGWKMSQKLQRKAKKNLVARRKYLAKKNRPTNKKKS